MPRNTAITATVSFEYEASVVQAGHRKPGRRHFKDVTAASFRAVSVFDLTPALELREPHLPDRAGGEGQRREPRLLPPIVVNGFDGGLWTPAQDADQRQMTQEVFLRAIAGNQDVFWHGDGNPFGNAGSCHYRGEGRLPDLPLPPDSRPIVAIEEAAVRTVESSNRDGRASEVQRIADSVIFVDGIVHFRRFDPFWSCYGGEITLGWGPPDNQMGDNFRVDRLENAQDWSLRKYREQRQGQNPERPAPVRGEAKILDGSFLSRDDLRGYTVNLAGEVRDMFPLLVKAPADTIAEWVRLRDVGERLDGRWKRVDAEELLRGLAGMVVPLKMYADRSDRRTAVKVAEIGRHIAALCERASAYDGVAVAAEAAVTEDAALVSLQL